MSSKISNSKVQNADTTNRLNMLTKFTLGFFKRPRLTAIVWVVLVLFGTLSYTTFLRREGFPSINIPITIVGGAYFVNDPARVDAEVAKPFSDVALQQNGVSSVLTTSRDNFFTAVVNYNSNINAQQASAELEAAVQGSGELPDAVQLQYNAPYFGATGPSAEKIDVAISFYSRDNDKTIEQLHEAAQRTVEDLNERKPSLVDSYSMQSQFSAAVNQSTSQEQIIQKSFDRFGERDSAESIFYNSVIIGVSAIEGADAIELQNQVESSLAELQSADDPEGYTARIVASFAPAIQDNISELQKVLLEGLIAVLIVGSLVIAWRASLITVISMITVITITLGILYAVGYTLNVITLFALILGLSLIVDDTIIMTEAIDVSRRKLRDKKAIVTDATQKVSRAMLAATLTAAISFAPLLFVSGILGSFIRAIPVTIIVSLLVSLLVALVFIPLFARFLMLRSTRSATVKKRDYASVFSYRVALIITKPMRWARGSYMRLWAVGLSAILVSVGFIIAAGVVGRNVTFNIFPPTKDTNGLTVQLTFPEGTTITVAQDVADEANKIFADVVGEDFVQGSYLNSGSVTQATLFADITSYAKRDKTSADFVRELDAAFIGFTGAAVQAGQQDIGPPASNFTVRISADNRDQAFQLAGDIADYLKSAELVRQNGSVAMIRTVAVSAQSEYVRNDGVLNIQVTAVFEDSDTSTLVSLAERAVRDEFDTVRLAQYGLFDSDVTFDAGQENSNQDSFRALLLAFPILLAVMYILLAFQFKSLLQPSLIFMAIPFSLFGVTMGLYLTDNAFSFFSMLGFFALIGLSIKNTILLTDYSNQARRNGAGPIDAAIEGLSERFRPLVATSLTAVVSLIPLAIASPFWQGLAVVLIFGLLSSTLLVILVFPYYYLGGEFLRSRIRVRDFMYWLGLMILTACIGSYLLSSREAVALIVFLAGITIPVVVHRSRRLNNTHKKLGGK